MGGRGSSAGLGGGGGIGATSAGRSGVAGNGGVAAGVGGRSLGSLLNASANGQKPPKQNRYNGIDVSPVGDYTANGNPNLIKYQGQEDDKTATYLAGTYKNTDLSQYDDGQWGFHDNSYQKLVLRMGLNDKPTVLSDADFNNYVQQTGAAVVYRGWENSTKADRFEQSKYFHTGGGIYGDGIYFSTDKATAVGYSGTGLGYNAITKMALSPTARVVDMSAVQAAMRNSSSKLQAALSRAGQAGQQNGYGGNSGESQMALKMGYNVIKVSDTYYVGLTADAFVVSQKRY